MRLLPLLFTAMLMASPVTGQTPAAHEPAQAGLPVSVDKIRGALQTTSLLSLATIDESPTFRVQIKEKQRLDELLATLNFKTGPVPAGGLYMAEQNRVMFPSVDNPTRQTLGAFNQGELFTILVENVLGHYLARPALRAISNAERAHALSAAKDEVAAAVAQYCSAQPNQGAGITICDPPGR